ncbi:hypothetical protein [Spirillospora sp. CA-294931]|uniref:hypothetical protein n=1 Tax=Spirillospora sp. CA-294931 TaxID=3240042 RepID=UPI003D8E2F12
MVFRRIGLPAALCGLLLALAPPPAGAAAPEPPCTPFGGATADEWAGCLNVDLRLSSAPAVGARAELAVEVRTTARRSDVRLAVELPAGLVWVKAPAGLRTGTAASPKPVHAGRVHRAEGEKSVGRDRPLRLTGTVKAVGAGSAEISAVATSPADASTASDRVFLTAGTERSALGFAAKAANRAVPAPGGATRAHPHLAHKPVGPAPKRSLATSCATGSWGYVDHTGASRVSANALVTVYDSDASGSPDRLAGGVTGADGKFRLCFGNTDEEGGGQDVFVAFATENDRWIVRNGRTKRSYRFDTSVRANVADGATTDFGPSRPADAALMRGVEAFDTVNTGWNWTPGTDCWDARDTTCRRGLINWAPDSTDGTYYSLRTNDVHLAAEDPDAPILVLHEFGHALMDDVYEDDFPPAPSCSPHYIPSRSSEGCAWTEGFATWYGVAVLDDPTFRWPEGRSLDLEGPTWGTSGWQDGDTVEGRVTGAMIDLYDDANEPGDACTENPAGPLWNTFLDHVSDTFGEFWSHRADDGHDVGPSALACLHHNTIDYR